MSETPDLDAYSLKTAEATAIDAPELPYRPPMPNNYRPRLGLIGAGGISAAHLEAYRDCGFDVAVICNRTLAKAEARRNAYFRDAEATDDIERTLTRDDIEVVDLTPHPAERLSMIETALGAGKHVLSQKPFVLDLDVGARLADLADAQGVCLTVNQNGRWAPHFSWMREAVRAGFIGDVHSCHLGVHWDHSWIAGTAFEAIDDLIFFDFAIHWFDFLTSLIGGGSTEIYATKNHASGQSIKAPLLAQALISFDGGQAALLFDAATRFGAQDRTVITGSAGTLLSQGPDLNNQTVTLTTAAGRACPALQGTWFKEGFRGTMGALLQAIEHGTQPLNNARDNLDALALAFAAIASANRHAPVAVGSVRSLAAARGMQS